MNHTISAAEANRSFSHILREVREGQSFIITAHGKPVARILPCAAGDAAREAARDILLARLEAQPARDAGAWSRDELYVR